MAFLSSMMLRTPEARERDNQTRQIQESIGNVEKHFGELCQLFAAYVRKTAGVRDKGDMVVREIGLYADTETPGLKRGLKQFADHLAKIQDYRQAQVERLEAKVVEPLKSYGAVVKLKREDLKTTQSARDREAKQMVQLERTRQRNPSDRQVISQAENELQRASMDARRITRQLAETIDEFEKKKIQDIKKILGDYVMVEMAFHAKALEMYTAAYQNIQSIDEEEDLEQGLRSLLQSELTRTHSRASLDRTGSSLGRTGTLQQHKPPQQQRRREEEEEESEEDDDDCDEDDDDDDEDEEATDDEH